MESCATCQRPTVENVIDGCTPYTCTSPCGVCGHIGDVHRDWYTTGFCRKCPESAPLHHHAFEVRHTALATR